MNLLHQIGDLLRGWLLQVPLPAVRGLFLLALISLLLWVLFLPKAMTVPPEGARGWQDNLKIWAGLALLIQILIYSLF